MSTNATPRERRVRRGARHPVERLPAREPGFTPDMNRVDAAVQYLNRVDNHRGASQRVLELMAFMEVVEGRKLTYAEAERMVGDE